MKKEACVLFLLVVVFSVFAIDFALASPADLNSDNKVNATDIQLIIRWILGIDQSNNATDMDNNGQVNIFDLVNASRLFGKIYGADSLAPTIILSSPSANLSAGTTSTILFAKTDERATCKYLNTTGGNYTTNMTTFAITGRVSHSTTLTGLANSTLYNYYIQCQDEAGNINSTNYNISFGVNSGGDEPQDPGSGYVTLDSFDNYATIDLRHAARNTGPTSGGQSVGFIAIGPAVDYDRYQLITGRGGSGLALRAAYQGGSGQQTVAWTSGRLPWSFNISDIVIFQVYMRIQSGWSPGTPGVKFFEFFYTGDNGRVQTGPYLGTDANPLYHVHWSSNPLGGAASNPYAFTPVANVWSTYNDGNWHRYTWQHKPASSLGATDGILRFWIDGQKILDVSTSGVSEGFSTSVERGYLSNLTISSIEFPDVLLDTTVAGAGTLDYDDFKVWTIP